MSAQNPPVKPNEKLTGGGGDEEPKLTLPAAPESNTSSKTRKALIEHPDFEFSPGSLVGSWFHRLENGDMIWQGCVVAEVGPGVYMLQIDRLDLGASNVQRLMPVDKLINDDDGYDWRFYDTETQARDAYASWVVAQAAA